MALCLLAIFAGWRPLRDLLRRWRRQRLISGYGISRLDNVILEDGIGGHVVVEHLLLTSGGLMVLLPRHCDGDLFGAEKIDRWTQMAGGRSFHFENPLHQLEELLASLRFHLPGIPVEGRVLFSGRCRFPKGRPERLLLVEELAGQERRVDQAVVPVLDEAWGKMKEQPRAEQRGEAGSRILPALRLTLSTGLMASAVGWLIWRLM